MKPFRMSKAAILVSLLVATTLVVASKSGDTVSSNKNQQQKQPISRRNLKPTDGAQQKFADKKQGDIAESAPNSAAVAQQLAAEEFVQIKPEELSAAISSDRDLEAAIGLRLGIDQANGGASAAQQNERQRVAASGSGANPSESMVAEHKSAVDEELNAHLAQDSLNPMESGYVSTQTSSPRSYSPMKPGPVPIRPYMMSSGGQVPRAPRPFGMGGGRHYGSRAPAASYGHPMVRAPQPYRGPRGPQAQAQHPPAYMMPPVYINGLRGKLSSFGGAAGAAAGSGGSYSAPATAPAYGGAAAPAAGHSGIGGTRYLPRGAAAGYAAFREFVRAQANKYKQGGALVEQLAYGPSLPPMMPPAPQHLHSPSSYAPEPAVGGQKDASAYGAPKGASAGLYSPGQEAGYDSSSGKTRVTVTQAYIPHPISGASAAQAAAPALSPVDYSGANGAAPQQYALAPATAAAYAAAPAPASYGSASAAAPVNPVLAKLYNEHGSAPPQGKQEYSKDYGMVIHYPQATVYAEPMTMEQLHKLTGNGISQILERLQYQIATGGNRDETNTLRPNNKHHIGHGFTIHAKEFYAPSKSGHYVPTTAAVISSPGQAPSGYTGLQQQSYSTGNHAPVGPAELTSASGPSEHASEPIYSAAAAAAKPDQHQLGSGYERVKSAVAASQASGRYNDRANNNKYQHSGPSKAYEGAEPLSAITSMLGSELESLLKANGALFNKHLEPEIHSQIQAYAKGTAGKGHQPLRYTEHSHKEPLTLHYQANGQYSNTAANRRPAMMQYGQEGDRRRPPMMATGYGPRHPPMMRGPRAHPIRSQHPGNYRQQQHPRQQAPMRSPAPQSYQQQEQQQQYQQQQYGSNMVEQAVQQQVMQILHDFKSGDEQYYGKQNQPMQIVNQGYPNKILQQKQYQQQQQHQQQQPQPQHQQQQSQMAGKQYQQHGQHQAQGQKYESGTLELPHGPNDQIGELADLVESLKGALEGHKPEGPSELAYNPAMPNGAQADYQQQHGPKYAPTSAAKQADELNYVTTALGQAPSYAMQVPVTNGGDTASNTTSSSYDSQSGAAHFQEGLHAAPAPATGHYGAPTAAADHATGPQAAPAGHEPAPATASTPYGSGQVSGASAYGSSQGAGGAQAYGGGQQQQQQAYGQAASQPMSYGVADTTGSQQTHQSNEYQQQVEYQSGGSSSGAPSYGQHQLTQHDFANAVQQVAAPSGSAENGYGSQSSGAAQLSQQPMEATAYLTEPAQHQQQAAPQHEQAYSQAYSTSEHTQVINHLVPTVAHAAAPASNGQVSYETAQAAPSAASSAYGADQSQQQQHPINQISIAAPTDSQYQSAQPLSSLVDSFPSEYQELLRHPSAGAGMLDSIGSHALESQTAPASYALYPTNATSSSAAQSSGPSGASGASAQAQPASSYSNQSYHKSSSVSSPSSSSSSSSTSSSSASQPTASHATSSSSAAVAGTKSAGSSSSLSDKSASSASASSQIKK